MNLIPLIRSTRISSKLLRVVFLIIFAFAAIVAIVAWSVSRVGKLATDESVVKLNEISRTSKAARDLTRIFSEIELLRRTFYEQETILLNNGGRLQQDLELVVAQTPDSRLKDSLNTLQKELKLFLVQCATVNRDLQQCRTIDQETHQVLDALEKLISVRLINQAKQGGDKLYLEQILGLVTGYRESLLTVGKLHAEHFSPYRENDKAAKDSIIIEQLDDLLLRLQTISTADSEVGYHGRSLLQNVKRYRNAETGLHASRIRLNSSFNNLNTAQNNTLANLNEINQLNLKATSAITVIIKDIVVSTLAYVICIALVVIGLTVWLTLKIIQHNINVPLQKVITDIGTIGKDCFRSSIPIIREDEWGTIQLALRDMHEKLVSSTAAVRESEERYSSIFAHIGIGIALISPHMEIISLNPVMKKWFPHINPELSPICYQAFNLPPAKSVCPYCPSILTLQDGEVHMSTTETPAPGGLRNYRIISTPIKADDGSVSAVIEVVEDITNEVTAEQTIRRSEEFVRNIIDSVDEGFIVFDADFRIITCNRTFCIWFGLNREDIQSKNMHDISEQYLCSGNGMEEIRSDVFTTGQSRTTTLKHVLADGSLRHHTIKLFPLKDETGTVTSVIETIQDITEQFLLIEEQQHLMEAAEAANRAKSEFLANMSHEIRTPMNGIMGMSQLLEYTDLTQEQKEYLDAIMISSKNLLQLINDILDLSKIESGTIELEQKSFRLIDCINELIKTQSGIIQAKGLSITAAIQADVPDLVMSDPLRLKQILLNIIGNAIKFSESGNITVSAKVLERHGDISVCVISVSDTGIGISEDNLKRIFAPFIQADASMARKYGGTGLGLAISRRLVELMNGHIDVDSCLGEGTTFSVTIPFLLDPHNLQPDPLTRNTRLQVYSARQLRILVAEDSEINCKVICGFLAKMGIQFECAQDGHEAVEKWRRGNFDLILMDIQMPVMTGEEALTAIRKLESDRGGHIPVVALTAHALNLDRDRLLAFGFDVYLSKPIEFELLMECIEKLV